MYCHRCYGYMVEVTIVNKRGRIYKAIVCADCGRVYSKDSIFKKLRSNRR